MANSLRAKLSKLRHDGHITDAEYQTFIKKMDGHDEKIREKAIDEFVNALIPRLTDAIYQKDVESMTNLINDVATELKAGDT